MQWARASEAIPDSNFYGASMGTTWGRQDQGGIHVGPMNLAIWDPTDPVIPVSAAEGSIKSQRISPRWFLPLETFLFVSNRNELYCSDEIIRNWIDLFVVPGYMLPDILPHQCTAR